MCTLVRFSFLILVLCAVLAPRAFAQDRPSGAVLETQTGNGVPEGTGGAVDRMVRARLDGLNVVRTSSGVALDLSEVQLALGCVGETVECLGPVADELSVRLLLIPHLDRTDEELMLTIALFNRQDGTLHRAIRRASGPNARTDLLDAVEGLLRELFGLPPPTDAEPHGRGADGGGGSLGGGGGLDAGPFVLMGVGVAALAIGIGLGVASQDKQTEWQTAPPPMTDAEVDSLHHIYGRAEAYAISADVLFVAGGLAAAGGLVWMIFELTSGGPHTDETVFAPWVAPNALGLSTFGRWEAR
jgi:hypothetical protein